MDRNAASAGRLAFTHHEPVGVVVAFSAFNHPLNLIAHQVGPAIAAGCPVIVKPAKATPLSCFRLVRILREAGLPDEWCQPLVTVDQELARTMVADSRVGFFSFIGSGDVGWQLRPKLAPGTRCSLEHGGVAPVDRGRRRRLGLRPSTALEGRLLSCRASVRVRPADFCRPKNRPDVGQSPGRGRAAFKVGDPTLPDTAVGPLIRESEVVRVEQWVEEAVDRGAERLCGKLEEGSGSGFRVRGSAPLGRVSTSPLSPA